MPPAACGRGPLALSQFSRRAAVRPCENWSAAPASPRCICRRQRSAQLPPVGGSLPLAAASSFAFRVPCSCDIANKRKRSFPPVPRRGMLRSNRGTPLWAGGCTASDGPEGPVSGKGKTGAPSSCGSLNMRRIKDDACIFRPLRQTQLPVSSAGRGRCACLRRLVKIYTFCVFGLVPWARVW